MNDTLVQNVPVERIEAYRGRRIIVRWQDSERIDPGLTDNPESIAYLQVLGTGGNLDELFRWEQPVPVDLVLEDLEKELPLLYRYSPLSARHPVRVFIPVTSGFSRAVKLAASLDFAVKLEPSQPDPQRMGELFRVVDFYLHQWTVSQPVEFIHSMFPGFSHGSPFTLWAVQEEDPSRFRFVTREGEETVSRKFAGVEPGHELPSFIAGFSRELLEDAGECCDCRSFEVCLGYFKWPEKDYRYDGVKRPFDRLEKTAED
ncbi:MAG TPA: hypothetical protein PLM79_03210 [Syntrophobacteraceae bacterium]|nr:hypothetical protein [Syntrophobacteraceae bacterium]